jgi:hypothetical protein
MYVTFLSNVRVVVESAVMFIGVMCDVSSAQIELNHKQLHWHIVIYEYIYIYMHGSGFAIRCL